MYDANNLYFSVYAYDSQPETLVVRSRARDGQILTGDNIQIALDPGQTRRNSYVFMMGPSGGRWDGLRLNNNEELAQWDTLWEGRAMRVPDGWVAEIAIPFRNLSYEPGQTDWGFDFTRYIRRNAEIVRWSSTNPALELTDVSEAGTLTGITAVTPGLGLDIQPYVALRSQHDWSVPGDGAGISGTAGGNHLLPGHSGADRHAHLQPGLLGRAARRAAGEHDAVLALLSRDTRLLSPGRRQFRVWRTIVPPHGQ